MEIWYVGLYLLTLQGVSRTRPNSTTGVRSYLGQISVMDGFSARNLCYCGPTKHAYAEHDIVNAKAPLLRFIVHFVVDML